MFVKSVQNLKAMTVCRGEGVTCWVISRPGPAQRLAGVSADAWQLLSTNAWRSGEGLKPWFEMGEVVEGEESVCSLSFVILPGH